jgi:hypothetical protein
MSCKLLSPLFFVATGNFPCRGKTHCALNAMHRYAFIHKTRRSKRELHSYVDKQEVHNTVCTQNGLLNSDLSSYVGSENASFWLLEVLAVGQTSIVACMLLCGQRPQTEECRLRELLSQIRQRCYVLQACKKRFGWSFAHSLREVYVMKNVCETQRR